MNYAADQITDDVSTEPAQVVEIPYDTNARDLFLACLRYVVDTCAAQGVAMGVQYELDSYGERRQQLI